MGFKFVVYLDKICPKYLYQNIMAINNESFGEYIRKCREEKDLPLRKVAAKLDIDPSTLSKIERGERVAHRDMIPIFAHIFNRNKEELYTIFLSDKVVYELINEKNTEEILKVAENKIQYIRQKSQK